MAYSSSVQVVNDANGFAYAFLSDNGQVWQCQWNPQAGQWEKAQVVPGASGGMKVAALFHPDLWNYKVDDDTATAPGIVLAYRVGSGKAAEVFTSLGQWNGQGDLTWSTPVQLTSDQADDQAFSLLEGGPGAFSLVSQKQSAGASLATRATQTVAPEDSDLYRTDLQINISNPGNALNNIITLNNISSGTPISMGNVSFTAEPASTAPTPGPTSGNTQLSRDALITPPAPQGQPMAAMTLMSAAADASLGVAWSPDDAFQPSEQAQTFSWGWKQLGQSLQKWSVTWGQKDAVDDSESEDDDADPGQDGRKSKLNESHKALSETSNNPSNRDRSESNVSLDRDPSDLGLTIPVPFAYKHSDGIVRSDKEEKLDLTLAGSFGLRPSTSSSGTTTSSSGTLSVAKDDGSSTKDLFDKADKDKVFGRGKIPGWKTVGKGFSWAGGGELNTVYDYNFKSSGPNLLGITSTVSLGFEFSHKILSFSEEGSTFIFESDESLGGLYKYSLNSKANSVLPPWLAYFGLIGGAAAELEMLLAGGYNESLLIRFREDANYRARLGLGIQQAKQGSSSFFGSGAPEEPNKIFGYLNGINAAVGSLLAAGGAISSAILGSDFDTGTLTSGAALQDSVALTARYLFRSIIGLDLSATLANFTSWRNDGSGIIGIDQLTPSISAGVALPMGITLGLLDFSHSFDFNLDYGQKPQSTQAAQAATRSSMMASAEPMLATSNSTGSAGGNYYNADQQTRESLGNRGLSGRLKHSCCFRL